MDIKKSIADKGEYINGILEKYLPVPGGYTNLITEAMNYSVRAGGKRLRPMLIMECAKLFEEHTANIEPFMAAIEMIHTYSLVHDDLPAMDNDMLRRGKPTTHAVYGQAQAILAGDGLLNLAFETMASACAMTGSDRAVRAMALLAAASGYSGMVGGQSLDVIFDKEEKIPTLEELTFIQEKKCAELIKAPMEMGAILAGAQPEHCKACGKMGEYIGVAFQLIDDILDIKGDEKKLGKPVGSDEKNNKPTMASILGVEEAGHRAEILTDKAIEILMTLPGDTAFLKDLFYYLTKRDY